MSLPTYYAAVYKTDLPGGTTRPLIFACEDDAGEPVGDFVVKTRSEVRSNDSGLVFEVAAAILADAFGLSVPEPAIVIFEDGLADSIPLLDIRMIVRENRGSNFGSRYLAGFNSWPTTQSLPPYLWEMGTKILVFDALIENPDRRAYHAKALFKPNVLWRSNELLVIDHELAFAFVYNIGAGLDEAGVPADLVRGHLFFHDLRGSPRIVGRFDRVGLDKALGNLDDRVFRMIEDSIPADWSRKRLPDIRQAIERKVRNRTEFLDAIEWALR